MSTSPAACPEYEQLLQELSSAVQFCAEYNSSSVFPIEFWKLTPERAKQLRDAAVEQRNRVATRVFIHRSTCPLCLGSP